MNLRNHGACLALALSMAGAHAVTGGPAPLISEGFDNVAGLAGAGWVMTNASPSPGSGWFQGNAGIFAAQSGAADSYIGANYLAADSGALSLWLITPSFDLSAPGTLSFYTRTDSSDGFADSLQIWLSPTGGSSVGSFTQLLYTVNPTQAADGYPADWTQYTVDFAGGGGSGRIAFVYSQLNVDNANYIGIDSVSVSAVPEPANAALFAAGLGLLVLARRRA